MESNDDEWKGWNWRTEGDLMVNGTSFMPSTPSSAEVSGEY